MVETLLPTELHADEEDPISIELSSGYSAAGPVASGRGARGEHQAVLMCRRERGGGGRSSSQPNRSARSASVTTTCLASIAGLAKQETH
jgi:hypothetical protein